MSRMSAWTRLELKRGCTPQVRTFPSNGFLARKDWYDLKIDAISIYDY
jgi:hypothetical protein